MFSILRVKSILIPRHSIAGRKLNVKVKYIARIKTECCVTYKNHGTKLIRKRYDVTMKLTNFNNKFLIFLSI
jgi:hypothetical protein